ncbi:DUF559 domain-containing protein [Saccharopolyspora sp. TS4A08]|uniref:DUF559 domain-containing protein n=1 Tax=Saccharopolyspora ipomoeae TaxID=3042027 RepID=A0ABT6PKB0_9PSEU|nr:DUF559 domain-containing protein [Saccharopolyspora sp. TS4A08]MDI2028435.1 DUF559 domain-containing protein [Saccharopolyspora sp. TS4A08]
MRKSEQPPIIPDGPIFVFRRCEAIAAELKDRHLKYWFLRVMQGVYTTKDTPLTHELKCAAVAKTLPEGSVITGLSAATLRGVPLADFSTPVEVIVPANALMMRRKGVSCSSVRIGEAEHSPWRGVGVAGFARIALDLLRQRSISRAVAQVDALLHAGVIGVDAIVAFLAGRHDAGIRRAWLHVPYLDERAESLPESVLRVEFNLSGLHPEPQVEVYDGNRFVARLDLAFEEVKVAVEYNGGLHAEPERAARDLERYRRLHALGWLVFVVTNEDLRGDLGKVIAEVAAAVRWRGGVAA